MKFNLPFKLEIILIITFIIAGCTSLPKTRDYLGLKIFEQPFKVSGGDIVLLSVTTAGAIPVEDEFYSIDVAGAITGKLKTDIEKSVLIYTFSLTSNIHNPLKSILIEKVYPDSQNKLLIFDNDPQMRFSSWSKSTKPLIIDKPNAEPFYKKEETTVVFKITIDEGDGIEHIYYQPSSVFVKAKHNLEQNLAKLIVIDNSSELSFTETFRNVHQSLNENDRLQFELACLVVFSDHYENIEIESFDANILMHQDKFRQLFANQNYKQITKKANSLMDNDINLKLQIMMMEINIRGIKLGVIPENQ